MSDAQRGPLAAFAVLSMVSATTMGMLLASAESESDAAPDGEIVIQARTQGSVVPPVAPGERDLLGGALPGTVIEGPTSVPLQQPGVQALRSPQSRTAPRGASSPDSDAATSTKGATRDAKSGSDFASSLATPDADRSAAHEPVLPGKPAPPEKGPDRSSGIVGGGKQKNPGRVDHQPDAPGTPAPEVTPGPERVSGSTPSQRGHLPPQARDNAKAKGAKSKNVWKPKRVKRGQVGKRGHVGPKSGAHKAKSAAKAKGGKKRGGAHRGRR